MTIVTIADVGNPLHPSRRYCVQIFRNGKTRTHQNVSCHAAALLRRMTNYTGANLYTYTKIQRTQYHPRPFRDLVARHADGKI